MEMSVLVDRSNDGAASLASRTRLLCTFRFLETLLGSGFRLKGFRVWESRGSGPDVADPCHL